VTEKLFRLLLQASSGDIIAKRDEINLFLKANHVAYKLETSKVHGRETLKDHVYRIGTIDHSNSIRGDKVKNLFQAMKVTSKDNDGLIDQLYSKIVCKNEKAETRKVAEMKNFKDLFSAWITIEQILTKLGTLTQEAIDYAIKAIGVFERCLKELFAGDGVMEDHTLTPYMHQLLLHYPELLNVHRSMAVFQNQVENPLFSTFYLPPAFSKNSSFLAD
jgi:hypothetical protein